MADCLNNLYTINFTNSSKTPISVAKGELVTDKADVAFVGKTKREYGEIFNENVLHLLENFACPEDGSNPGNPDLSVAFGALLENPVQGQIWYNTTDQRPYQYDGTQWLAMGITCDVAGNYGVIASGEYLPLPVCPLTGYVFTYEECSWIVSPYNYPSEIDFMKCVTDENGLVTVEYRPTGGGLTTGFANYQIIGIKDNMNLGTLLPEPSSPAGVTPTPTSTPVPSLDPTQTPTSTPGPTPTPTATSGATPTATPTQPPAPSQSNTPTPTVSLSNTPTPTAQPTPTPTPTPSDDKTGDIIEQTVNCAKENVSACLTVASNGTINGAGCLPSAIIGVPWVLNGFPVGFDGSDYTFTATNIGLQNASGPLSGNFGTSQSWCLSAPPPGGDFDALVQIDITGPPGTAGGTIYLALSTFNVI